jgi:hypothetical protein
MKSFVCMDENICCKEARILKAARRGSVDVCAQIQELRVKITLYPVIFEN